MNHPAIKALRYVGHRRKPDIQLFVSLGEPIPHSTLYCMDDADMPARGVVCSY